MATPTKYPYPYSDFPNNAVNSDLLTDQIKASSIVTALMFIDTGSDICTIVFEDVLSSGDKTTLDGIVATHTGDAPTPSLTLDSGAGTGATGSITGDDEGGSISVDSGTSPGADSPILSFNFSAPLGYIPSYVLILPGNDNAGLLAPAAIVRAADITSKNFILRSLTTTLLDTQTYVWFFQVAGP